jgi:hypothetical protein
MDREFGHTEVTSFSQAEMYVYTPYALCKEIYAVCVYAVCVCILLHIRRMCMYPPPLCIRRMPYAKRYTPYVYTPYVYTPCTVWIERLSQAEMYVRRATWHGTRDTWQISYYIVIISYCMSLPTVILYISILLRRATWHGLRDTWHISYYIV